MQKVIKIITNEKYLLMQQKSKSQYEKFNLKSKLKVQENVFIALTGNELILFIKKARYSQLNV